MLYFRHVAVFYLLCLLAFLGNISVAYAHITNGENAMDLIGEYDQTNFTNPVPVYTKVAPNDGPNIFGFGSPLQGIVFDGTNHKLYVQDRGNDRILVYNLTPGNLLVDHQADNVIGQPNFYTNTAGASQSVMSLPVNLDIDGVHNLLYVADPNNNRVMVYNTASITNGMNAINVIGEPDFSTVSIANSQPGLASPRGVAIDSTHNLLYVAANNNNRVTVYNTSSISNGMNALNVLGQTTFSGTSAASSQPGLNGPYDLDVDSVHNRLYVSDSVDNSILVYDVSAITNGMNALNVLGQTTFNATGAATTQNGMSFVNSMQVDPTNNRLYVADTSNNRITVFDVSAISNGMNALNVIGQAGFGTATTATSQSGVNGPRGVALDSTNNRLYVADSGNNRVSVYDTSAISNGENAIDLLGQYDETNFTDPVPVYSKSGANDALNRFGYLAPWFLTIDATNHRLFTSEANNNRVLVYNLNTDNTLADHVPDYVLGEPNFYTGTATTTQMGMNFPQGLSYDSVNNRLFVNECSNNRLLIFNVASISNGMNAMNVLGQSNFTSSTSANTQAGENCGEDVTYDSANTRLFVANNANRVMVYNLSSISNGMNAVNVLGQANFTSVGTATGQNGMTNPGGLAYDAADQRLFVANAGGNNVQVYNVSSITNGMNAANVIGQPNFSSNTGVVSQSGLLGSLGLAYDAANTRLFVANNNNSANRVTVYNVSSISNGMNAVNVIGQPDFSSSARNDTQAGMGLPRGLAYDATNARLYVAQGLQQRITVYDVGLNSTFSGTVYSDEGTTNIGAGKTVSISVNGAAAAASTTTASDGSYSLTIASPNAGDVLTVYLDNNTEKGVMVTKATGNNMSGLNVYKNDLITRCDNACSLTDVDLSRASNGDSDISAIYTVGGTDLTLASGKSLFIPSSQTFAPGGNVTVGGNFTNNGTYTSAIETVTLSGTGSQTFKTNGSSFYNVTVSGSGGTYTLQDALTVANALTISTGATLDTKSGSNFAVSTGTWSRSGTFTQRTATLTLTGTGTLSDTMSFYNLVINGSGITVTLSNPLTVTNNLNLTTGTLSTSGHAVAVSGVFTTGGTLLITTTESSITTPTNLTTAGTVVFNNSGPLSSLYFGNAYYNLTFQGTGVVTLPADPTVNGTLNVASGATLNVNNKNPTVAGDFTNSGTLQNTSVSTVTLNGSGQTLSPGSGATISTVTLTGSSGTVALGSNFTIGDLLTIPAGRTLSILTHILNAAHALLNNLGQITFGSGGQLIQASSNFYLANSSFDVAPGYSIPADKVYFSLTDPSANLNGQAQDTISVTISCPNDSETVTATETTNTSGVFRNAGLTTAIYSGSATNNNGTLSCANGDTITASYTDAHDTTDTNSTTATASSDTHPAAPTNFVGTATSATSITWTWTDNANNETGFRLYDSNGTLKATIPTANVTSYTETGLSEVTSYSRKLVAYNTAGNSAYSATTTTKTLLATPTNFTGTAISATSITWTWDDNSNHESGYILEDDSGTIIHTITTGNVTTYTETGLQKNTDYLRKIVAYNSDGNSAPSNTKEITTLTSTPTTPAVLISPLNNDTVSTNLPSFSWLKALNFQDAIDDYTLHIGSHIISSISADGDGVDTHTASTYVVTYGNENDGNDSNDTVTVALKGTSSLPDGTYVWYVTSTDEAGNTVNSVKRTLTVQTVSIPTGITAPPSITEPVNVTAAKTAAQKTAQEIAALNPSTAPIATIVSTLRQTLRPPGFTIPQLQQTTEAFRLRQAKQYDLFMNWTNNFLVYILRGQQPWQQFIAAGLNNAGDTTDQLTTFLQARQPHLPALDALGQHVQNIQPPAFVEPALQLLKAGQDTRIRAGLANRQTLTNYLSSLGSLWPWK